MMSGSGTGLARDGDGVRKVRVVVVDGSARMRTLIAHQLASDGRFEIVGTAGDPFEAREVIKKSDPDLITLDVDMPRMDGLSFLEKIMQLRPTPVVMLSSETQAGSYLAVRALAIGAVDCLGKTANPAGDDIRKMADRLFAASKAQVSSASTKSATLPPEGFFWNKKILMIGASTGGVEALERVLRHLPKNGPPTLIVQHMPTSFLESFSNRLSELVAPKVELATMGKPLERGFVYIAPGGGNHLTITPLRGKAVMRLRPGPQISGHRPSIDVLFQSAIPIAKSTVAVLLTGMGRDGAAGLCELRSRGARTVAQDEASCVIFGMPRIAAELGGAECVANINEIGPKALALCSRGQTR